MACLGSRPSLTFRSLQVEQLSWEPGSRGRLLGTAWYGEVEADEVDVATWPPAVAERAGESMDDASALIGPYTRRVGSGRYESSRPSETKKERFGLEHACIKTINR